MFYDIKEKAKARFQEDYINHLVVFILYLAIMGAATGTVVGNVIVGGPLTFGLITFFIKSARKEKTEITNLFDGINNFINTLIAYVIKTIFIFLWSLLFIIPGIIKSISYSQTFYIMYDDPSISGQDAIAKSQQMMKGHKMEYFLFLLSFIGWWILTFITFGLVYIFYFGEYLENAKAEYYINLREKTNM